VRSYLRRPLLAMAQANPDVEVLVRKLRRGKAAVLRGHYGKLRCARRNIANW
jgi:large subunit ribosomal protein L43